MFELGKEVICINDSTPADRSKIQIKKGNKYEVLGIMKKPCCGALGIYVGTHGIHNKTRCSCGAVRITGIGSPLYYGAHRFAPIDNSLSELTTADILNEPQHA